MKSPKKPKKTAPKPRNPEARALRSGAFKPKVEQKKDAYRRKPKHPIPPVDEAQD